jgi:hypothetical protein
MWSPLSVLYNDDAELKMAGVESAVFSAGRLVCKLVDATGAEARTDTAEALRLNEGISK